MRSLLANPWALVKRGGTVPGNRPATRLALLITKSHDGSFSGYLKSKSRHAVLTKKAGAAVYRMDRPVDLLVYFRGRHHLIECKTGKGKLTEDQEAFIKEWPGPVFVIRTPEAAIEFLNGGGA